MTLVDDTALDTEERHYMAYVRRCREQGTEPLVPKEYHAHYTPEPANAGLWFRSDLEPVIERILDGTASTPMPRSGCSPTASSCSTRGGSTPCGASRGRARPGPG